MEKRKLYEVVIDAEAEKHGQIRVIDESGEDYLYTATFISSHLLFASLRSTQFERGLKEGGFLFCGLICGFSTRKTTHNASALKPLQVDALVRNPAISHTRN